MNAAFVDTSVLLALTFREPGAAAVAKRLASFEAIYASDLLEAEFRSACRREGVGVDETLLFELEVIFPPRSLHVEYTRVLAAGYVRGADCFHLATALLLAPDPAELVFLTLDQRQGEVARALGFAV